MDVLAASVSACPGLGIADRNGLCRWRRRTIDSRPIFDITHFDVIPFNLNMPDSFEQAAYSALFAYRDASQSDPGSKSFRVVNWLLASNHSQIIDV